MKNILISIIIFILLISIAIWFKGTNKQNTQLPSVKPTISLNTTAPEATFTKIDGTQIKLSSFKGKKVMFWLVATWCSSCSEGARVLSQNQNNLKNLKIITLKTYGNAGYPGPSIKDFATQSAPKMLLSKNWLWGNLTQKSTRIYNPRNYPDIYFLIDKDGIIKEINDAPAATIGDIIKFAKN